MARQPLLQNYALPEGDVAAGLPVFDGDAFDEAFFCGMLASAPAVEALAAVCDAASAAGFAPVAPAPAVAFAFVEAAANILTNPALDPYGKIPEFKFSAVKVQAARRSLVGASRSSAESR